MKIFVLFIMYLLPLFFIISCICILLIRLRVFKRRRFIIAFLSAYIITYAAYFHLNMLPCQGELCDAFRFIFTSFLFPLALLILVGLIYLLTRFRLGSIKSVDILLNIFAVISIVFLLLSLLFWYGHDMDNSKVAIKKNNVLKCKANMLQKTYYLVFSYEKKSYAEDKCYQKYAETKIDVTACEHKSELKSLCLRNVGFNIKDPDDCTKLKNSLDRNSCYTGIYQRTLDPSICYRMTKESYQQKNCLLSAFRSTKNISHCKNIGMQTERDECYLEAYDVFKNASICEKITYELTKGECLVKAGQDTEDLTYCKKTTNSFNKAKCYSEIGMQKLDTSICLMIDPAFQENRYVMDNCITHIAVINKNLEICNDIPGINTDTPIILCYSYVANATNNVSICDMIKVSGEKYDYLRRNMCYTQIAENLRDPEICSMMPIIAGEPFDNGKDKCYTSVAEIIGDVSVCESIEDKDQKSTCITLAYD